MKYDEYDSDESDLEFGRDMFHHLSPREKVVTEIVEKKLYLTDMMAANDLKILKKYGIEGVISLGGFHEQPSYIVHEGIHYNHIYIDDCENEPISQYFDDAIWFIDKIDGPVLVHCWAGISRSSTIVIAYLIKQKDMTFQEAVNYVQERRTFIAPNDGFLQQLEEFAQG